MTNWYESLDAKERRPYKLAVRKIMKAVGYTGSNQNLDSYADAFITSEFGAHIQGGSWWNNNHMVKDRLLEFASTPEGDITSYGGKLETQDAEKNVEKLYDKAQNSTSGMDYYRAEKIRKTNFMQRWQDKQRLQHQGLGRALVNTASEGLSARMKMLGKLIDPMFLLKSLPLFGKNLSLAYGVKKGRSQSDLDYFSDIKKRTKTVSEISPTSNLIGDTLSQEGSNAILIEMFNFMKSSREEDLRLSEMTRSYDELNESLREDNHRELMNVFLNVTKNKNKADKKIGTDSKKRKVKEPKIPKNANAKQLQEIAKKESSLLPSNGLSTLLKGVGEVAATASKYVAPVIAVTGLGAALGKAEAGTLGYNAANRGTIGDKIIPVKGKLDLENMTLAEIQKRQSIKFGAPNESEKLFAVGKYQMIPETLKAAIEHMKLDLNEKLTGDLQERIYKEYLIVIKRPDIARYLNSPEEDPIKLRAAIKATSMEWASVADPDIPGGKTSHYGNGNKASISVDEMAIILMKQRQENLSSTNASTAQPKPVEPTKVDVSKASIENNDLWTSVKASKKTIINHYGQNNYVVSQKSVMFNSGPLKREPNPIIGM